MRTSTLTVALVSVLLVAGAGTAGALTATDPFQQQESPTGTPTSGSGAETTAPDSGSGPGVTFDDQNSSGESVLVESATLPEDGFVAIYDSTRSGNETDQIIGVSYPLSAGTSDNIRIQFDQPINGSKSLTAVIHTDSNGNDEFDFVSSGGRQDPAPPEGDERIVDIAQVTAPENGADSATESGGATENSDTTESGGATEADTTTQSQSGGADEDDNGGTTAGGGEGDGDGGSGVFGPGFGPALAVVALLAVALLAVRRH